nr:hypothetical protein [uncultured bacterium]
MTTELKITGLEQLRADLKRLPEDLQREAAVIVQATADAMAVDVLGQYAVKTGNLRSHVRVETTSDVVGGVSSRVVSKARHAWLYERGTAGKKRSWANGKNTGAMPAKKIFAPVAPLRRRIMTAALVDLVQRAGLTVTGSAT